MSGHQKRFFRVPHLPWHDQPRQSEPSWKSLRTERLLDTRLCDLGLTVPDTLLGRRVEALQRELERAGLRFRPYVWFSNDWFTPDGLTGFAVPFYLADRRLIELERAQMSFVEGGRRDECMRLLRHETGHAIDNAYRLRRRKSWREVFGRVSVPYRMDYAPDPTSREHVINLGQWYAQSHPVEDFAETFAVWLRSPVRWRTSYAGHPAFAKLEYVDGLMREIARQPQPVRSREHDEPLTSFRMTLRQHYRQRRARYGTGGSSEVDAELLRVFGEPAHESGPSTRATSFFNRHHVALRRRVEVETRLDPYLIRQVINELLPRCRQLDLRLERSEAWTLHDATDLIAGLAERYGRGAGPRCSR
jgi:hypothetical protein